MTFALQPLTPGFTPAYVQIADQIRAAITSGALKPGDALPSQEELASSVGVARMTVNQALGILKTEGLLASQRGKPTTVLEAGSFPVPPNEVVTEYLISSTPGALRVFDLSLEELIGITAPHFGTTQLFLRNEHRPVQLLLRPHRNVAEVAAFLDSTVSTFQIRQVSDTSADDAPAFVHMDNGETFMRLGLDGLCTDPARSLHFTLNRGEGDSLQTWFQAQWAQAREVPVQFGRVDPK